MNERPEHRRISKKFWEDAGTENGSSDGERLIAVGGW
jgi:hypothetical protein